MQPVIIVSGDGGDAEVEGWLLVAKRHLCLQQSVVSIIEIHVTREVTPKYTQGKGKSLTNRRTFTSHVSCGSFVCRNIDTPARVAV